MRFQPYWESIFEYADRKQIIDETFERQRNLCVDCMYDYKRLTGETLISPVVLWPETVQPEQITEEITNPFDLVAWFRWRIVREIPITPKMLESFLSKADTFYGKGYYPCYLPYELPLIHNVGTPEQQEHCREKLRLAPHLQPPQEEDGSTDAIILLLAMRTSAILKDPERSPEQYRHCFAKDSRLRELADQILTDPNKIVFRCPY